MKRSHIVLTDYCRFAGIEMTTSSCYGNQLVPHYTFSILTGIALAALAPGFSLGQTPPRPPQPDLNTKKDFVPKTASSGFPKALGLSGEKPSPSAHREGTRASAAQTVFTPKYLALRERLLRTFEHGGQIAESADGDRRVFSDQTLYMGFALLTFAGEARILRNSGHDPRPTEMVVRRILEAFDSLDKDAERERYHTAVPGFFLAIT